MDDSLYFYKAIVTKVYDGDTITVDLDLGCNVIFSDAKIRLLGINTPEIREISGIEVRDYVAKRILGKEVIIKTKKDKRGKYGRLLGTIFYKGDNINAELLEKGMALPY